MKKLIPLFLFGAAFGVIEASVVIYMRPLFNAGGDAFALRVIRPETLSVLQKVILTTELWREVATLVLLAAAAAVAARSLLYWASYFVFSFGVWDIFYYIWLKVRIGWPASLLDWDILFLIPRMWFAPVIVPCIISLMGISMSVLVVRTLDVCRSIRMQFYHWLPVAFAMLLWLVSFLNRSTIGMTAFPVSYSWSLFIIGMVLCVAGTVMFYRDFLHKHRSFMFRM